MFYLIQEGRRTEEGYVLVPSQADTEQMIETDKVVHMGMGNEDSRDLQYLPGGQGRDVTQIEKEGFIAMLEFEIDPRVIERGIYQCRV